MRVSLVRSLAAVAAVSVAAFGAPLAAHASSTGSVASTPVAAPTGAAGTVTTVMMTVGGLSRSYNLFVPEQLPAKPVPLLVVMHGMYGNAAGTEKYVDYDTGAAQNGVLVAYPDGTGADKTWNGGRCCGTARDTGVDDLGFLDALLSDVESRYSVDPSRVAMVGFSNGGVMAERYACERSGRVDDVVAASAVFLGPVCAPVRPLNVLEMHGMADTVVPFWGSTTSTLVTNHILPSVLDGLGGFGWNDHCSGPWTSTTSSTGVVHRWPLGCPAGVHVDSFTSPSMDHAWSTAAQQASTGLDETGLSWSWLARQWGSLS